MVTGWGRTISRGPIHTILQEVTVTTMTNKQCVSTVSSWEQQMTETMICAQAKAAGRDACKYFGGGTSCCAGSGWVLCPDRNRQLGGKNLSWSNPGGLHQAHRSPALADRDDYG